MNNIKEIGDRIIFEPVEKKETESGITLLVDPNHSKPCAYGRAIEVGEGCYQNGVFIPTKTKPGDIFIYYKSPAFPVDIGDTTYWSTREADVICILPRKEND